MAGVGGRMVSLGSIHNPEYGGSAARAMQALAHAVERLKGAATPSAEVLGELATVRDLVPQIDREFGGLLPTGAQTRLARAHETLGALAAAGGSPMDPARLADVYAGVFDAYAAAIEVKSPGDVIGRAARGGIGDDPRALDRISGTYLDTLRAHAAPANSALMQAAKLARGSLGSAGEREQFQGTIRAYELHRSIIEAVGAQLPAGAARDAVTVMAAQRTAGIALPARAQGTHEDFSTLGRELAARREVFARGERSIPNQTDAAGGLFDAAAVAPSVEGARQRIAAAQAQVREALEAAGPAPVGPLRPSELAAELERLRNLAVADGYQMAVGAAALHGAGLPDLEVNAALRPLHELGLRIGASPVLDALPEAVALEVARNASEAARLEAHGPWMPYEALHGEVVKLRQSVLDALGHVIDDPVVLATEGPRRAARARVDAALATLQSPGPDTSPLLAAREVAQAMHELHDSSIIAPANSALQDRWAAELRDRLARSTRLVAQLAQQPGYAQQYDTFGQIVKVLKESAMVESANTVGEVAFEVERQTPGTPIANAYGRFTEALAQADSGLNPAAATKMLLQAKSEFDRMATLPTVASSTFGSRGGPDRVARELGNRIGAFALANPMARNELHELEEAVRRSWGARSSMYLSEVHNGIHEVLAADPVSSVARDAITVRAAIARLDAADTTDAKIKALEGALKARQARVDSREPVKLLAVGPAWYEASAQIETDLTGRINRIVEEVLAIGSDELVLDTWMLNRSVNGNFPGGVDMSILKRLELASLSVVERRFAALVAAAGKPGATIPERLDAAQGLLDVAATRPRYTGVTIDSAPRFDALGTTLGRLASEQLGPAERQQFDSLLASAFTYGSSIDRTVFSDALYVALLQAPDSGLAATESTFAGALERLRTHASPTEGIAAARAVVEAVPGYFGAVMGVTLEHSWKWGEERRAGVRVLAEELTRLAGEVPVGESATELLAVGQRLDAATPRLVRGVASTSLRDLEMRQAVEAMRATAAHTPDLDVTASALRAAASAFEAASATAYEYKQLAQTLPHWAQALDQLDIALHSGIAALPREEVDPMIADVIWLRRQVTAAKAAIEAAPNQRPAESLFPSLGVVGSLRSGVDYLAAIVEEKRRLPAAI